MFEYLPYGIGINYRGEIAEALLENIERFDFIEVITDLLTMPNHLPPALQRLLESKPCVLHGLKMSLGAAEPLDKTYLEKTIKAVRKWRPLWFSDHLAYTKIANFDIDQLMPVRRSSENLRLLIDKLHQIRGCSATPFLIENITYYFEFPGNAYSEVEFLSTAIAETGCGLLLDLNNLYINASNHGFDPYVFLEYLDLSRVLEIHMAGGISRDGMLIDSHGHTIAEPVWQLLEYVCERVTPHGIVIERDANFDADDIFGSLDRAREILNASPVFKRVTACRGAHN